MQEIIEEVKGRPEEMVIATLMLRSMQQAKYSPESLGHFGLSTEYYTHFTSPIRRYPDLIVHRLIREYLIRGKTDAKTIRHNKSILPDIAKLPERNTSQDVGYMISKECVRRKLRYGSHKPVVRGVPTCIKGSVVYD